ncbi:hypothetical protein AGOR_G00154850 [Albula goreensis]|uniref:Uncharacterized protein n=1 Tax=Albula goreensis TaxID=1534307 RepID=A0A8T3D208_9TELE|nr:hypothetical protein AGOR_G00154850 [Albula goreensis]
MRLWRSMTLDWRVSPQQVHHTSGTPSPTVRGQRMAPAAPPPPARGALQCPTRPPSPMPPPSQISHRARSQHRTASPSNLNTSWMTINSSIPIRISPSGRQGSSGFLALMRMRRMRASPLGRNEDSGCARQAQSPRTVKTLAAVVNPLHVTAHVPSSPRAASGRGKGSGVLPPNACMESSLRCASVLCLLSHSFFGPIISV